MEVRKPKLVFNPKEEGLFARFFNQYVIVGTDVGLIKDFLVDTAPNI